MDGDSFTVYIKTKDIYADIPEDAEIMNWKDIYQKERIKRLST